MHLPVTGANDGHLVLLAMAAKQRRARHVSDGRFRGNKAAESLAISKCRRSGRSSKTEREGKHAMRGYGMVGGKE